MAINSVHVSRVRPRERAFSRSGLRSRPWLGYCSRALIETPCWRYAGDFMVYSFLYCDAYLLSQQLIHSARMCDRGMDQALVLVVGHYRAFVTVCTKYIVKACIFNPSPNHGPGWELPLRHLRPVSVLAVRQSQIRKYLVLTRTTNGPLEVKSPQ
jgi:hypothetical protein